MVNNQGCEMNVVQRSDAILAAIFGKDMDQGLEESFSVFNSPGNNSGKIYLPLHICLKGLVETNLPFRWDHDIRETKVVIHY